MLYEVFGMTYTGPAWWMPFQPGQIVGKHPRLQEEVNMGQPDSKQTCAD